MLWVLLAYCIGSINLYSLSYIVSEKIDLSILIPARNEMFLARTVKDILDHIEGNTEILVGLDGQFADPPIEQHPKVNVIYYPESIGQRAITNQLAKIAKGKYLMKVDAHCSFDQGFDVKLISKMQDDWTMIPEMRNLHAFDWVCKKCGNRWFQSPTPTHCKRDYDGKYDNEGCDSTEFERDMIWKPNPKRPKNHHYRFDNTMHFQYWREYGKKPEVKAQGDIVDTLSAQGSAFLLTKKKYFELNICDEKHGSWGQQGVEVACKTWLSGGRLVTNKSTWYAHMFRTQGGDFGFPYPNTTADQARKYSRDLWLNNKWDKAIHPLSWLLEKFAPVPDWDFSIGILYYSDMEIDPDLQRAVQEQIKEGTGNNRIVSVTLKPCSFGDNIHVNLKRGYLTMARQILYGLENLETDIVFFTEHDVLYHPSHFDFVPSSKEVFYYNTNVWRLRVDDGLAVKTDNCRQLSGLVCYRELAVKHFKKRVEMLEVKLASLEGDPDKEVKFNKYVREMGFEPGTHKRAERVDDYTSDAFESKVANIDLRHGANLTPSRWNKDQFRNQKFTKGWQETYDIPGWGKTKDLIRFK